MKQNRRGHPRAKSREFSRKIGGHTVVYNFTLALIKHTACVCTELLKAVENWKRNPASGRVLVLSGHQRGFTQPIHQRFGQPCTCVGEFADKTRKVEMRSYKFNLEFDEMQFPVASFALLLV